MVERTNRLGAVLMIAGLAAASGARATTVTSDTIPGICNVVVTLYGSPTPGGTVTLYKGPLAAHSIALQVYPNEGNRVCYTRSPDPNNCTGAMTPEVCTPVSAQPGDVFDIK